MRLYEIFASSMYSIYLTCNASALVLPYLAYISIYFDEITRYLDYATSMGPWHSGWSVTWLRLARVALMRHMLPEQFPRGTFLPEFAATLVSQVQRGHRPLFKHIYRFLLLFAEKNLMQFPFKARWLLLEAQDVQKNKLRVVCSAGLGPGGKAWLRNSSRGLGLAQSMLLNDSVWADRSLDGLQGDEKMQVREWRHSFLFSGVGGPPNQF